jgi:hypothetical protein
MLSLCILIAKNDEGGVFHDLCLNIIIFERR